MVNEDGRGGMVSRQQISVEVEFYGFSLQESTDDAVAALFPEGWEAGAGQFLTQRPGRLDVESAGHTHTAAVDVEVWAGEPPEAVGQWDAAAEGEIRCPSGVLDVWGVTGGPVGDQIMLGAPGVWRARVWCAGRNEVAEQAQHGVPEGVERYLVRFWRSG